MVQYVYHVSGSWFVMDLIQKKYSIPSNNKHSQNIYTIWWNPELHLLHGFGIPLDKWTWHSQMETKGGNMGRLPPSAPPPPSGKKFLHSVFSWGQARSVIALGCHTLKTLNLAITLCIWLTLTYSGNIALGHHTLKTLHLAGQIISKHCACKKITLAQCNKFNVIKSHT